MHAIIRKFTNVHSVESAARRSKTGIGQILRQSSGFKGYYVLDGGNGVGVSVTLFESRESAEAANEKVLAYLQDSLPDLMLGDPEIISGVVLVNMSPEEPNYMPRPSPQPNTEIVYG